LLYKQYTITVTSGAGSCVTRSASDGGVYNLAEGSSFQVSFDGGPYTPEYASWVNDH
jgi:hypothetical protein